MRIIQALLAEHVVFHTLFDEMEASISRLKGMGEVRALAGLLEKMLERHSELEDELLMEPIEPSLSHLGQDASFHQEHVEIDTELRAIRTERSLAQGKKLLVHAIRYSRRHFDKEERVVFPLAEKVLSIKSQELLGRRWQQRHKLG